MRCIFCVMVILIEHMDLTTYNSYSQWLRNMQGGEVRATVPLPPSFQVSIPSDGPEYAPQLECIQKIGGER